MRWILLLTLCWTSPSLASPVRTFGQALPQCAPSAETCVGIVLHVAPGTERPLIRRGTWFERQLTAANRRFAPIGVAFEVVSIKRLTAAERHIASRSERDRLGRGDFTRGVVHVYLVGQLDNVDEPGVIQGVHWRDRAQRARRWLIVASTAPRWVLAHELGHFFGLPHSTDPASIMNKAPRAEPPWSERGFVPRERRRMKQRLRRALRSGAITRVAPASRTP